tara:strand:- start:53 stop:1003 length:951 start_codon:yes stop_codon:yes gene_type:complete
MKLNNYFFPDYSKKSGLGHFYRCYKYSNLIRKGKIYFLYKNKFKPNLTKILKKKGINSIKFNRNFFNLKKKNNSLNILTIDSYTKKNIKFNKNSIFDKVILLSDKKPLIINPNVIIDHTFKRKKKFYFNEQKKKIDCYVGIDFFPFEKIKKILSKRKIILINFGTTYDVDLINKSLKIIKKLNFNKEIIIISNHFDKKFIKKDYLDSKIQVIKSVSYLHDIYKKTFLSFGSCGISLYEKLLYRIPSICTPVAGNQMNNYQNFSKSKLIIKMSEVVKIDNKKIMKDLKSLKKRMNYFIKTIDKKKIIDIINLYEKKN